MLKVEIVLLYITGLLAVATAKPGGLPFLSFENGNIGVNFGGYKAHAGLGGILTGDFSHGGLQAGAETPWGPRAQAGLGGSLSGNGGHAGGRLFAGADLGNGNPGAAAGLGGAVNGGGHAGGELYAKAGLGQSSPSAAAGLGGSVGGSGHAGGELYAKAGLGQSNPGAAAGLGGEIGGHGIQGGLIAGATTGVQSAGSHSFGSVEPGFVGKTVQKEIHQSVPNVEVVKSFNTQISHSVPTVTRRIVETEVHQVPVQPNVVSFHHIQKVKARVTPKKQKTRVSTVIKSRVSPIVHSGLVVEKAIYPAAADFSVQKYVETQASPVQQVQYYNQAPAVAASASGIAGGAGFYGGGFGGYGGGYDGGYGGGFGNSYYVKPQPNAQLFDDIFNIPISTLTAVNQLLRNKGK